MLPTNKVASSAIERGQDCNSHYWYSHIYSEFVFKSELEYAHTILFLKH